MAAYVTTAVTSMVTAATTTKTQIGEPGWLTIAVGSPLIGVVGVAAGTAGSGGGTCASAVPAPATAVAIPPTAAVTKPTIRAMNQRYFGMGFPPGIEEPYRRKT